MELPARVTPAVLANALTSSVAGIQCVRCTNKGENAKKSRKQLFRLI